MRTSRGVIALGCIASLVTSASAAAQTRVPDQVSCLNCRITQRRIATLGTVEGPGALGGFTSRVSVDGRGRYWVNREELPMLFDSTGRFLTTVGRPGRGPGEFQAAGAILFLPGDSILVFDVANARATVMTGDLKAVRAIPLAVDAGSGVVLRWPDRLLINGYLPGPFAARGAEPFMLVSLAADRFNVRKPFGTLAGESAPSPGEGRAALARGATSIWTSQGRTYRLIEWDSSGTPGRVLERSPAWWSVNTYGLGGPNTPPRSRVHGITIDEQGLLWVFVHVAAPAWREAWSKIPSGAREVSANAIRYDKLYRTIVEVIDPRAGRVVARNEMDQVVAASLPNRRAAIYRESQDGVPHFDIVRFTLSGR